MREVTVVPLTAVVRSPGNPNGFAVYVTEGAGDTVKVHTQDVTLGDTYGNNIAVLSGLSVQRPGGHIGNEHDQERPAGEGDSCRQWIVARKAVLHAI